MRTKILLGIFFSLFMVSLFMVSCSSIPKASVDLSNKIGADLQILHTSHRNAVQLYYRDIKSNINTFIDDVYTPFIIQHVLESERSKHRKGESSIYTIIERAGKEGSADELKEALDVMVELQEAINIGIMEERDDLLSPILKQEMEVLNAIDQSYQNISYANATLTAYITSAYKVKESQKKALSIVGLEGLDTSITDKLVKLSDFVGVALKEGKQIEMQSDSTGMKIRALMTKIKEFTSKTSK